MSIKIKIVKFDVKIRVFFFLDYINDVEVIYIVVKDFFCKEMKNVYFYFF